MINIAQEFSRFPAGRYYDDGPNSGQKFREKHLLPALKSSEQVEVVLDGVLGYGSSFLEEAFGGLVREEGYSKNELSQKLQLICKKETLIAEIRKYISEA